MKGAGAWQPTYNQKQKVGDRDKSFSYLQGDETKLLIFVLIKLSYFINYNSFILQAVKTFSDNLSTISETIKQVKVNKFEVSC